MCHESPAVDFKESTQWNMLKYTLARTVMGMGNLRDGGIIIIGASERNGKWSLTGITEDHLSTYDPDDMGGVFNSFSSPPIDAPAVVTRMDDGKQYLVIGVPEFDRTPIVCKKNGPEGSGLQRGAFYVRRPAPARTTRVTSEIEMQELLELAAEKRARSILETAKRIGMVLPKPDADLFDMEIGGL